MLKWRRPGMRLLAALSALGILSAVAPAIATASSSHRAAAAAARYTVRWAYRYTPQNVVFVNGGFSQKFGLHLQSILFSTGLDAQDALISGSVDVAEVGVTPALTSLANDPGKLEIIGVSSYGGGIYRTVVPVHSSIHSMKQLVGKKIAIKVGSGCYTAFLLWVKQNHLNINDFKIVDLGDTAAMSALETKSVDAVIYWEPIPAELVAKGVARQIFSFQGLVDNPVYLLARTQWVRQNPQAAARLMAAWGAAEEYMNFHPLQAARMSIRVLSRAGLGIPVGAYEQAITASINEPWLYGQLIQETKGTLAFLKQEGKVSGSINWTQAINPVPMAQGMELLVRQDATRSSIQY